MQKQWYEPLMLHLLEDLHHLALFYVETEKYSAKCQNFFKKAVILTSLKAVTNPFTSSV